MFQVLLSVKFNKSYLNFVIKQPPGKLIIYTSFYKEFTQRYIRSAKHAKKKILFEKSLFKISLANFANPLRSLRELLKG